MLKSGLEWWRLHQLHQGKACEGEVTSMTALDSSRGTMNFRVEYTYSAGGQTHSKVQILQGIIGANLKVGDPVPIMHPTASPEKGQLGSPEEVWGHSLGQLVALTLVGAFFFLAPLVELGRRRGGNPILEDDSDTKLAN